jgi:hydrogenase maturation protease
MDLAYALGEGWDAVIMVDAVPRGERPGTLFVIEAELGDADVVPEAHGMDPVKVLALARELGPVPERVLVVGCEPETRMSVEDEELLMELSETVRGSIDEAVRLVESLIDELRQADERREDGEG